MSIFTFISAVLMFLWLWLGIVLLGTIRNHQNAGILQIIAFIIPFVTWLYITFPIVRG